jgi:hypothetical protein
MGMRLGLEHQLASVRLEAELWPLMMRRRMMCRLMMCRLGLLTMTFGFFGLTGCGSPGWLGNRTPGERMTGSPERTWSEYGCSDRKLPFVEVNAVEVTPETVVPGTSFDQRFVYSACLPRGRPELPVRLRVRIYRQAQETLTDVQPHFLIRPGRWTVDATVATPRAAPDGPYRLRVDISGAASADAGAVFTMHR